VEPFNEDHMVEIEIGGKDVAARRRRPSPLHAFAPLLKRFDPSEPRDPKGEWTTGAGAPKKDTALERLAAIPSLKPEEQADMDRGTDQIDPEALGFKYQRGPAGGAVLNVFGIKHDGPNWHRTMRVPLKDLIPSQTWIERDRVKQYLTGVPFDEHTLDTRLPKIAVQEGKYYIQGGHHRLAAAVLRGDTHADVDALFYDEKGQIRPPIEPHPIMQAALREVEPGKYAVRSVSDPDRKVESKKPRIFNRRQIYLDKKERGEFVRALARSLGIPVPHVRMERFAGTSNENLDGYTHAGGIALEKNPQENFSDADHYVVLAHEMAHWLMRKRGEKMNENDNLRNTYASRKHTKEWADAYREVLEHMVRLAHPEHTGPINIDLPDIDQYPSASMTAREHRDAEEAKDRAAGIGITHGKWDFT
jgi:hypothetical protein